MRRLARRRRLFRPGRLAMRIVSLLVVLPLLWPAGLAPSPAFALTVTMISPRTSTATRLSITTDRTPTLTASVSGGTTTTTVQFQLATPSSGDCSASGVNWTNVGNPTSSTTGTYSLEVTPPLDANPTTWCARAVASGIPSDPVRFTVEPDTDGDGLADRWESSAIYVDKTSTLPTSGLECVQPTTESDCVRVDLSGMGFDRYRRDILVVMDYFADATHTHALNAAALKKVADAFDTAPIPAPSPCPAGASCKPGITLHVDQGPDSVKEFRCGTGFPGCVNLGAVTIPKQIGSPISVSTATSHGITGTSPKVAIAGVDCATTAGSTLLPLGNVAVNGIWTVTVTSATSFTLNGSAGTLSGSCTVKAGSVVYTPAALWGLNSNGRALPEVVTFGTIDSLGNYVWTDFDAKRDEAGGFTSKGLTPVAHYAISAHQLATSTFSGVARRADEVTRTGKYFIVSLGLFPDFTTNLSLQAGSFMHELGHNLGLGHAGPVLLDPGVDANGKDTNHKPNYLSVMNHSYQRYGLIRRTATGSSTFAEGVIDYSRSPVPAVVTESSLSESAGLGPNANDYGARRYCAFNDSWVAVTGARGALVSAASNVDWNCNGSNTETGVNYDVSGTVSAGTPGQTLTSYDDWANLQLAAGGVGATGVPAEEGQTPTAGNLTKAEADKVAQVVVTDISPGNSENIVYIGGQGPRNLVTVAILTTKDFDATTVDGKTVRWGKMGLPPDQLSKDVIGDGSGKIEDVNKDGFLDLVLHFDTSTAQLTTADTQACLQGQTKGGQKIFGCDDVKPVVLPK